jgi:inner membrane protein
MTLWAALSMLPDADVLGLSLGVPYGSQWGHRGFTHSFVFTIGLGLLIGLCARACGRPGAKTALMAALVLVSHPLFDTLTNGGRGCALFWPFDATRYFAPWQPIPVSPIGFAYLSPYGMFVAAVELVIFSPAWIFALWPRRR